ncbi:hypothetical protein JHW43_007153 [Diplocarpon mali]|nr:hypothetical protein JHW43_007153 [Diplocarpon mali]
MSVRSRAVVSNCLDLHCASLSHSVKPRLGPIHLHTLDVRQARTEDKTSPRRSRARIRWIFLIIIFLLFLLLLLLFLFFFYLQPPNSLGRLKTQTFKDAHIVGREVTSEKMRAGVFALFALFALRPALLATPPSPGKNNHREHDNNNNHVSSLPRRHTLRCRPMAAEAPASPPPRMHPQPGREVAGEQPRRRQRAAAHPWASESRVPGGATRAVDEVRACPRRPGPGPLWLTTVGRGEPVSGCRAPLVRETIGRPCVLRLELTNR